MHCNDCKRIQYIDHAEEPPDTAPMLDGQQGHLQERCGVKRGARGGVVKPFPLKLHEMLDQIEDEGLASVVCWQPHGRAFMVRKPREFVEYVMPKYFNQSKFASFQRQLNLYGFRRLTSGRDKGGYYHELFLRGKRFLCERMFRVKIKGTKVRKPPSTDDEPDFYAMPSLSVSDTIERFNAEEKLNRIEGVKRDDKGNTCFSQTVLIAPCENSVDIQRKSSKSFGPCTPIHCQKKEKKNESCELLVGRGGGEGMTMSAKPAFISEIVDRPVSAIKGNADVLFFEGKPFHYLDKFKNLPEVPFFTLLQNKKSSHHIFPNQKGKVLRDAGDDKELLECVINSLFEFESSMMDMSWMTSNPA